VLSVHSFYAVCRQPNVSDLLNYENVTTEGLIVMSTGRAYCKPGYRVKGKENIETSHAVRCWITGEWQTWTGCEPKGKKFL